jgi:serine/threonine protein phosphatase PrpC
VAYFETATVTVAHQAKGEDRVEVFHDEDRIVIVVADGAAGTGSGDQAAETVVREVRAAVGRARSEADWAATLVQVDCRVGVGESTAVIVDLSAGGLCGASVGDSQAWIMEGGELDNLTAGQVRKPLLGTGEARPVGFSRGPLSGILVVASDGFANYVKRPELLRRISEYEFCEMPRKLVDLVRLRSGELWDDVSIVVCRKQRPQRSRQRYAIDAE